MSLTVLKTVQTQVNLYGYSLFMIFGNIGNVFSIIIFSRRRQNPCTIYLLSLAITNVVYLTLTGVIQIFFLNYNNAISRVLALCKIHTYMTNVIGQISKTMIVFASIDRFLNTNSRATFRAFSRPTQAKYLIGFSVIFWSLLNIHVLIMTTIVNEQCSKDGIYSLIFSVYIIIFVGFIPPIVSGVFGYLSYRNMRQLHNRVQPIRHHTNEMNISMRKRDRQLLSLVIAEVLVYIVTAIPFPLTLLEMLISSYTVSKKSLEYAQIEVLILSITLLLMFINSAAPFYIYLIATKSFRRDVIQLFINGSRRLRRQQVDELARTVDRT